MHAARFKLAPMSGLLRWMTIVLLAIPIGFLAVPLVDRRAGPIALVGLFVALLYAGIWLLMRPSEFVVRDGLMIVWPLRQRWISRDEIVGAEEVDLEQLRREFGVLLRFGAGGLWGGFGLALSTKGKHLGLLVSRHRDGFVLLRCRNTRSILMTPERPNEFVECFR